MGKQLQFELWEECGNGCKWCVPAGSTILLSNFTKRNIEDIKVGDEVLTYDHTEKRMISTKVLNTSVRYIEEPIYHIEADGHTLDITKDHPILSARGKWIEPKYMYTNKERTCYTSKVITVDESIWSDKDYQKGYIIACMLGDGLFKNYRESEHNIYISKDGNISHKGSGVQIRFTVKDEEITAQLDKFLQNFGVNLPHRIFEFVGSSVHYPRECIHSSSQKYYNIINTIIQDNYGINRNESYCKGFLAGAYDCEGHLNIQNGTIRIVNMHTEYFQEICDSLDILQIPYTIEQHATKNFPTKDAQVRLWSKSTHDFIPKVVPACIRKRFRLDKASKEKYVKMHYNNIQIKPINFCGYVYNIQTEAETYIVNDFVVHNCYLGDNNKFTPDNVKLNSLQNALEKIQDLSNYPEFDTLSYLGGEFFQGQLKDPEVYDKFMELMRATADLLRQGYIKEVWIYATLTIGFQKDLYDTLELFKGMTDRFWLLTSYDTMGRFHTQKMEDSWKYHMKNIYKLYPDIHFNTTTILTADCIEKYLNNEISFKSMMEEYHTLFFFKQVGCDDCSPREYNQKYNMNFVPKRSEFLKFLAKFKREESEMMWDKLFNIQYRCDVLYRNGNTLDEQMQLNIRHKDSKEEIELGGKLTRETVVAECGHLKQYHAYCDCDGCVLCDKEMMGE